MEVLNPRVRRGPFRAALFDFDGTLSLIREGWPRVMIGMMAQILHEKNLVRESDQDLWQLIERFVMALNGHPSIVQMARFCEEITARGGQPESPSVYLSSYLSKLMVVVKQRWALLEKNLVAASEWVVPNAHAILRALAQRGVILTLASGTDIESVRYEGQLLQVLDLFEERIYAPSGDDASFSKGAVADRILQSMAITGEELVGFGDGVVETSEVKRVGGVMVGVASAESGQSGINPEKRDRLAAAGADIIIPDYSHQRELLSWLWGESD